MKHKTVQALLLNVFRILVGTHHKDFSVLQIVQTSFEVHPTSYPMGTEGSFPGGKAHLQLVPR
jgi:hypothetical protein